eukprot:GHVQ01018295.1.p1 GENE.GHVQ01018295.1~~GHVQ01018295.1.p1  ORF type:complete len:157 (+),score=19.75 GHVQ01018295.1:116-586(+)
MENLRRSLWSSLFLSCAFEKALVKATYDDTTRVDERCMQEVLETLLGSSRETTPAEAIQMMQSRFDKHWTWRVALKSLLLLQYIVVAPQTTVSWLQFFLADCSEFRAAEDAQAASHASIVRLHGEFLAEFCQEALQTSSIVSKNSQRGTRHAVKEQ